MSNPSDPLPRPGSPGTPESGFSNGSGGWSITKARFRFLDGSGDPLMAWKDIASTTNPIDPWQTRVDTASLTGPGPRMFMFDIEATKDGTTMSSGPQTIGCTADIGMAMVLVNNVSPDGDTWEWHAYLSDVSGYYHDGGTDTAK